MPLTLTSLVTLTEMTELDAVQRRHLLCIYGDRLETVLAERNVQSVVFSEAGERRYRLYTKPHGSGYLLPEAGNALLGHASQHLVEVWSLEQRPLFAAIDDAIRAASSVVTEVTFPRADSSAWHELLGASAEELAAAESVRRSWWPFT